jgi:16S rRNA (guanine527-N7)-methyltransferase
VWKRNKKASKTMEKTFVENYISVSKEQVDKFRKYYELLVFYNEQFNITAITEKEEVYKKHFIDSVLGLEKVSGKNLLDVGSGGGFPAIPLKIMNEDINLTMLEATGKKCEFLKTVAKELDLKNVVVINDRAENLSRKQEFRGAFDTVTARAVARLNILSEYCMPFVKTGGKFLSYKGDAVEEIKEAENAIKILGGKIEKVSEYFLYDAKRTLVEIIKIKETDTKYPRSNGAIRKKPL